MYSCKFPLLAVIFFIGASMSKESYKIYFNSLESTFDKKVANVTALIHNNESLTVEADVYETFPDPLLKFDVTFIINGHQRNFLQREISYCDVYKLLGGERISQITFHYIVERSNWNFTCPITAGHYYTRNYSVVTTDFPRIVPEMGFRCIVEMKHKMPKRNNNLILLWKMILLGEIKVV